jgi:glutathione S-transferase
MKASGMNHSCGIGGSILPAAPGPRGRRRTAGLKRPHAAVDAAGPTAAAAILRAGGPFMITLHHCVSARSFRPLWTLEELGLPYALRMLPFPPRVHAKTYLQENPLGTIPLMVDGDTRMTESAAICQYLCARHGGDTPLQLGAAEPDYGAFLNYLHFGEATLTFPQTLVLRYGLFEPDERRQPQVAQDYAKWFLARLRGVEARLDGREFLAGGRFTVADVSVGYALMLASLIRLAPQFPERVRGYWQRLQEREAFQRAMRAQHEAALQQGVSPEPPMAVPA